MHQHESIVPRDDDDCMVDKCEDGEDDRSVVAGLVRQDEMQEKGYCVFARPQRRRIRLSEVYEPVEGPPMEKSVKGRKRWALARVDDGSYQMKVYCMLSGDKLRNYQGWEAFDIQALIGGCYVVSNEMVEDLKQYWKRSSVAELESMAVPEAKTSCNSLVLRIDRFNVVGLPPTPSGQRTLVSGGPPMTPVTPSKRKQTEQEYKSPVKQINPVINKIRPTRQEFLPRTTEPLTTGLFEPRPPPQKLKIVKRPQPITMKQIPLDEDQDEQKTSRRLLSSQHQIRSVLDQFGL